MAERAARLAKADLVTGMVGEFPELQGLMGGYYAAAQGEPVEVAEAVRDHYKPVGQGDEVPTAPVTVAVALADKLDTIAGFFAIDERPTGSKDPFALRRAALGSIALCLVNKLRFDFGEFASVAGVEVLNKIDGDYDADTARRLLMEYKKLADEGVIGRKVAKSLIEEIPEEFERKSNNRIAKLLVLEIAICSFMRERLIVQSRAMSLRPDVVAAVFSVRDEDDFVNDMSRVHALQAFVTTEDGANLLAGYKRAANILKKEAPGASRHIAETGEEDPLAMVEDPDFAPVVAELARAEREANAYDREPAEAALIAALDAAEPQAEQAIAAEDFAGAMAALATLRAPIDAFFTDVTVNDADPHKRTARLALLARVRDAVHRVADFSKIEG